MAASTSIAFRAGFASFVSPPHNPRPFRWDAPRTDTSIDASIGASKDLPQLAKAIAHLRFMMPSTIATLLDKLSSLRHNAAVSEGLGSSHAEGGQIGRGQAPTPAASAAPMWRQLRAHALQEADLYLHMMDARQLSSVLRALAPSSPKLDPARLTDRILDILSHDGGRAVLVHGGAAAVVQLATALKALQGMDVGGGGGGASIGEHEQGRSLRLRSAAVALAAAAVRHRAELQPEDLSSVLATLSGAGDEESVAGAINKLGSPGLRS